MTVSPSWLLPVVIGAALLASPGMERARAASPPSVPFTMHIVVTSPSRGKVRVRGTTNLPNGSLITISSARAFKFQREAADRDAAASVDKGVRVLRGHFSTLLELTQTSGVKVLVTDDPDPQYGSVITVDTAVMVCADFETGNELLSRRPYQPESAVTKVVGANGEALVNSPQKITFGPKPSYWLETSQRLVTWSPLADVVDAHQTLPPHLARLAGFCLP